MRMEFSRKLPDPTETKDMLPLSEELAAAVKKQTAELKAILSGQSDRIVLIIGPCSADSEDSVLDYVSRLVPVQEKVKDRILIVPRIYTNKPRTTGEGYKGLVHQPDPNARPNLLRGIITTRELHMRVVKETGFAGADEMLYPENYPYLDDLLGYVAVGARSVEDQQHRLTASAVDCPVGMKNPTSGDLTVMMNGILAAQHQHDFILNPAAVIDCNHANSGKNPFEQPRILKEVLLSGRSNPGIRKLVKGFMIESYLEDGNQPVGGGVYGKSITDACLGWDKSERLIYDAAEML